MKEIVLKNRKNGMSMMLLFILLYLCGVGALILGGILLDDGKSIGALPLVLGIIWCFFG